MDQGLTLVNALLHGDMAGLAPETTALFVRTGLIHLFSASGFHVAVAIQLAKLCTRYSERWLKHRRSAKGAALLLQFAFMIFFGYATGWSSPMVRAFTFTFLLQAARFAEIWPSKHWVFLLSLLLSSLFGRGSFLSFFLSAAGMAGVLYIKPRNFLSLNLGPWLFTLPIIIWVFGVFSALAPLWNLTIGSLIAVIVMPPAVLHLICESLSLPDPFFRPAGYFMELFTHWLQWGDGLLGGAFYVARGPWLAALALLFLCAFASKKYRLSASAVCALLLFLFHPLPRFAVLDVGQGDSIFVRTGERLLVDAGPPGRHGREALATSSLGKAGIGAIDNILLTHLDLDHRGGIESVLRNHRVRGALWLREDLLDEKAAATVLAAAERAGIPVRFLTDGNAPTGLQCFLAPARGANDHSPLCIATLARGTRLWLTGDMSDKAEAWLLAHHPDLPRADFLKVAHHGSRTSSSAAFLQASHAQTALISVGAKNHYGHPTQETIWRLKDAGMEIRRTDQEGNLAFY